MDPQAPDRTRWRHIALDEILEDLVDLYRDRQNHPPESWWGHHRPQPARSRKLLSSKNTFTVKHKFGFFFPRFLLFVSYNYLMITSDQE